MDSKWKKRILAKATYSIFFIIMILCGFISCSHSSNNEVKQETMLQPADAPYEPDVYSDYEIESLTGLYLGDEFKLDHYYIRNETNGGSYYYIDDDNVLWGYGNNTYGQLGNGQQYTPKNGYDSSWEDEPQRIAENVIHVNFGNYFVIYLTESGDLFGVGSNLNGIMGMEASDDLNYVPYPELTVAVEPVLLMQNVTYARCGMRSVAILKNDGSVWWLGEIQTTSSKTGNDTTGMSYSVPTKILDNAVYVTCGNFSAGAVKEDGSLWTWGNNTFGSCGTNSGDKDFIENPVMVAEQVKMIWFDEVRFDTSITVIKEFVGNVYERQYPYVTFIEKTDGTLAACGYKVAGVETKSQIYPLYGDLMTPVAVSYSDIFQPITLSEADRAPQLKFSACEYGWSPEDLVQFLEDNDIAYQRTDMGRENAVYFDINQPDILIGFDENKKLSSFDYLTYGSRDGRLTIGMERDEVEAILGTSPDKEITFENNYTNVRVNYVYNDLYYTISYYNGKAMTILESNTVHVQNEEID